MMEWIKDNQDNLLAIGKNLFPLIIIGLIWIYLPYLINKNVERKFYSSSIAIIDSLSMKEGIKNTDTGSYIVPFNYTIYYSYQIANLEYTSSDFIQTTGLSRNHKAFLKNLQIGDSIKILYMVKEPSHSKIQLQ